MKYLLCALALVLAGPSVQAADPGCEAQAAEKKLAGAAKASFLKRCTADAEAATKGCEATAAERKLAGAARNSFVRKCAADAAKAAAPAASAASAALQ